METKYTILIPGEPARDASVDVPVQPSYGDFKRTIGPILTANIPGEWEHVTIMLPDGNRSDMFVDENFLARGLPRNPEATEHYRRATMTREPKTNPEDLPPILGPAIVFHRRIWF